MYIFKQWFIYLRKNNKCFVNKLNYDYLATHKYTIYTYVQIDFSADILKFIKPPHVYILNNYLLYLYYRNHKSVIFFICTLKAIKFFFRMPRRSYAQFTLAMPLWPSTPRIPSRSLWLVDIFFKILRKKFN